MQLSIEQKLKRGLRAQRDGRINETDRLYKDILRSLPNHPDSNYSMGVLSASLGKLTESITYFNRATKRNKKIKKFWVS